MHTPYEMLDRTLSSPAHFLAAYLVLANTFLITTHHPLNEVDKHEYAVLYAWWIIFACTQIYNKCTEVVVEDDDFPEESPYEQEQEIDLALNVFRRPAGGRYASS